MSQLRCDETRCEIQSSDCASNACPCGTDCQDNPVACAQAIWSASFFQAMKSVQVDILKSKIHKSWGPMMDKAADAVLEAMQVKWQSMMAEAKAKRDFGQKLETIWKEAK